MPNWLLHGPSYSSLRTTAIKRANDLSGYSPRSVLWLEQNDHIADQVADQWAYNHDPLRLTVSSLDKTVRTWYDIVTGPRSFLDALTRRRLVDRVLREIDDMGMLTDAHRHRNDVLELISELEAEGYDSEAAIRDLTTDSAIPDDKAKVLIEIYDRLEVILDEVTTNEEFTGSEAYQALSETETASTDSLPSVDVVVLSGYYDLTVRQRAAIRTLSQDHSLVMTLPIVEAPQGLDGANEVAMDAFDFYRSLIDNDKERICHVTPPSDSELTTLAGRLYTPVEQADIKGVSDSLQWIESPTPEREVRHVARSIRNRVATDPAVTQDNVLVVVPGLISYREQISDVFAAHGLTPVTVVNKLLYQTNTGRAMIDLVAICRGDDITPTTLASLVTNPLVALEVDGAAVSRVARALSTTNIDRLLEETASADEAELTTILKRARMVADSDGAAVIDAIRDLFGLLDLKKRVEIVSEGEEHDFDARMEARAYRRVDQALDAIERVARQTSDPDPVSVLDVVADELDQLRVPPPTQSADGVIEVAGPREAFDRDYDHLYLIGMTAQDFPPNPDRPRFFEAIFDGLDGITPTDPRAIARYQFATMLASADTVRITTPAVTNDDDPLLESTVVDELQRTTGIEPTTDDLGNGYREDVQRSVGQASHLDATVGVEQAVTTGAFEGPMVARVRRGVTCARNRAAPDRTEHDGQLDSATVEALYPKAVREPYSPTRLNSYAKCGFRFAMERILDLQEPLDYAPGPDPLDYGRLVHNVLEHFYRGLQDEPGEPVNLEDYSRDDLEQHMLAAAEAALAEENFPYEGSFYDRWLEALFAGLGTPETNPHYGPGSEPTDSIHTAADGVFSKFISEERTRDNFPAPGWFEVAMDLSEDDGEPLVVETPTGPVPVGGRIDRVSVDWSQDPPIGLVHDYKSSSRSPRQTVDGVSFQLPLYALAASNELADEGVDTPLDAAFYILDHGQFGDGWKLSYYLYREGEGTDADYRRLIEDVTPRRVGDLVTGLEHGAFQPTVLDADTAGCRHCDFRDICDVRYHKRRDVIATIDDESESGYVPQEARPDSFLDTCGGDNE